MYFIILVLGVVFVYIFLVCDGVLVWTHYALLSPKYYPHMVKIWHLPALL